MRLWCMSLVVAVGLFGFFVGCEPGTRTEPEGSDAAVVGEPRNERGGSEAGPEVARDELASSDVGAGDAGASDAAGEGARQEPTSEPSDQDAGPDSTGEYAPDGSPGERSTSEMAPDTPAPTCEPPPGKIEGTQVGVFLRDETLLDCAGNIVKFSSFCKGKALWLSFHHGWCPHCRKLRDKMEQLAAQYQKDGLVAISILVQSSSRTPPSAQDCKDWSAAGGYSTVISLYDKNFRTQNFWEQNYTALNVFVGKDHIITAKEHTDDEQRLHTLIKQALGQQP